MVTYPVGHGPEGFGSGTTTPQPDTNERTQAILNAPTIRMIRSRTRHRVRSRILEQAERRRYGSFAIGVEILPSEIIAVLIDPSGNDLSCRRRTLVNMRQETVVREVGLAVRDLAVTSLGLDLPRSRIAIGLQIGGPVDPRTGTVKSWRNYPTDPAFAVHPDQWRRPVPLAALVEEETHCRTVVENDAVAYTAYEQRFGVGRRAENFAVILIRDGVGGGVVLDRQVLTIPLEIGHLTVQRDGRPCACGNKGCIDSLAGQRGIRGAVGEVLGGKIEPDSIKQAIDMVEQGHDKSEEILTAFRQGGEAIAHGVAAIVTLFGVSHIVVYCDGSMNGVGKAGQPAAVTAFFDGVGTFAEYTFPSSQGCQLVRKPWRSVDGALGAALIALNQLFFVPV